ncbi:hypothetical protein [Paenibacillus albidus]|uniref:hypothetical protein n=1 Tax=Paenibacillus albidus TaxID=2041023 RepID=UPI0016689370|nr:hypothetical protein [Paenibacillus albidus]
MKIRVKPAGHCRKIAAQVRVLDETLEKGARNVRNKYRSAVIAVYALIVLAGVIWHAGGVSAEDTIKLTVNSHTASTVAMNNMKPGDESRTEYTVINAGDEGFHYDVDFKFRSGDEKLYNILQMTLEKEGVILYSGVMSEAEGRVAIGSLAGGEQDVLRMAVTFPWDAGNEYQGMKATVAFEFSASGEAVPSAEPSTPPAATASPGASAEPGGGATAPPSPDPSTRPGSEPTAAASPGIPGTIVTPGPAATPGQENISVTEAPVPLGGGETISGVAPTPSPGAEGSGTPGSQPSATPAPDDGPILTDEELPLAGPDGGDELPETAEPWFNLILLSLAVAIISIIVLRTMKSRK